MQQSEKLTLQDIKGDLKTYFNWSANAVMPIRPGAADLFLQQRIPNK